MKIWPASGSARSTSSTVVMEVGSSALILTPLYSLKLPLSLRWRKEQKKRPKAPFLSFWKLHCQIIRDADQPMRLADDDAFTTGLNQSLPLPFGQDAAGAENGRAAHFGQ